MTVDLLEARCEELQKCLEDMKTQQESQSRSRLERRRSTVLDRSGRRLSGLEGEQQGREGQPGKMVGQLKNLLDEEERQRKLTQLEDQVHTLYPCQ